MPIGILSAMHSALSSSIKSLVRIHNAQEEDIYEHATTG